MSKVCFFVLGLFCGVLLLSLYALTSVDEANRTKPEVLLFRNIKGHFVVGQLINNDFLLKLHS